MYDYTIDTTIGKWVEWLDTVEPHEIASGLDFADMVIPTKDSVRNVALLQKLLTNRFQVLCVGPTGTGKTINIESYLMHEMDASKYIPLVTSFSAQTSANDAQMFLDAQVDRRPRAMSHRYSCR